MTTTLITRTLDDHLLRLLTVIGPDRIRDNGASITLIAGPGTTRDHDVTRQVWHLHDLGLAEQNGATWSRTAAGDSYLTQHSGGAL